VIRFTATILRKQDDLPRYIIVKPEHLAGQTGSFAAQVSLDDGSAFARNIHPWGKGSDAFFFNLTQAQCRSSGVDTGNICEVMIIPA
jgi:hypothetical protein